MIEVRIQLPLGFTPVTTAPTGSYNNVYEVLYAPSEKQTHFENGVAKYDAERREGARWRTTDGDALSDYGVTVLAWRKQTDEMKIIRLAPEPVVGKTEKQADYDRAIALLAKEHYDLGLDGAQDDRPSGVGLAAAIFHVPVQQVVDDYRAATAKMHEQRKR
jgi:hypothetical protein